MDMSKKYGGVIENWTFNTLTTAVSAETRKLMKVEKVMILSGYVVEDPLGRWEEGWHMRSSLVMDYDEESGTVETMSTIYTVKGKMLENADMGDLITKVFY